MRAKGRSSSVNFAEDLPILDAIVSVEDDMSTTVFYAWQSDQPGSTTRNLIQRALEDASQAIRDDITIDVDPRLDKDTAGVPGSPDIVATIFEKIDRASVFVADVTLITADAAARPSPNPNVLIELGYALKVLGWERVVLVMNTAYGPPGALPFDIRQRRTMTFSVQETDQQKAEPRRALQKTLEVAVRAALAVAEQAKRAPPPPRHPADELVDALAQKRADRLAVTRRYVQRALADIDALRPERGNDDELLVQAIDASVPIVERFGRVAEQIAIFGDEDVREEMLGFFEQMLRRFDNTRAVSGPSFTTSFDLFRFMAHETFVVFIEAQLREKKWSIVDELLRTPLTITGGSRPDRTVMFDRISEFTELLDRVRRDRLKENRTSIRADLLKARYSSGPLAERVSWQQFMDTDYFLFLRSRVGRGSSWDGSWRAWSMLYLSGPPEFIQRSVSRKAAAALAQALGVKDVATLTTELRQADKLLENFYGPLSSFSPPSRSFDWSRIGNQ
jgi:hypothetical protein